MGLSTQSISSEQELAALLGASVESIHRWKVPADSITLESVVQAKDSVGALRGWWPRGKMPAQFRNMEPWKTKDELAEVRKLLAERIGVHVNTLRVLWRKHEIPPLPPDGVLSLNYISKIETNSTIRRCKSEALLAAQKKELATKVGETVATLHHLWRHNTIRELPQNGTLTTRYVSEVKTRVREWRKEQREQRGITAERKMKAATWNRKAAQTKKLFEALASAGVSVSLTSIRRWLRTGQINELPSDGGLPVEYVHSVVDYARRAPERHRENTRLAQNRPGVQGRKRKSQRRAARRPGEKERKSRATTEMWASRKAKLASGAEAERRLSVAEAELSAAQQLVRTAAANAAEARAKLKAVQQQTEKQDVKIGRLVDEAIPKFERLFSMTAIQQNPRLLLNGWTHSEFTHDEILAARDATLSRRPKREWPTMAARCFISLKTNYDLPVVKEYHNRSRRTH